MTYGIDAPRSFRNFGVGSVLAIAAGVALLTMGGPWRVVGAICLLGGLTLAFLSVSIVWGSLVGKIRLRDRLLAAIPWRGDERVLDVGCGRGLMLIGAAGRLTSGKAIGIDIWRDEDQSRNSRQAVLSNAAAQGVGDRVEVLDADARAIPFADESFDVVLSSFVIHNLAQAADRATALGQIVRVLKPGGRAVIIDILKGREYAAFLRGLGLDVTLGPWKLMFALPTRVVTATKRTIQVKPLTNSPPCLTGSPIV